MKILKFILGAGNENTDEIEKLSYIFSLAGFNMIDTACKIDTVNMVKSGIKKANKEKDVKICVSVGLQEDIHVNKIAIDNKKCTFCKYCVKSCKQNAIYCLDNDIFYDEKKCIGCQKCVQNCPFNVITSVSKYNPPEEMLKTLLNQNDIISSYKIKDGKMLNQVQHDISSYGKANLVMNTNYNIDCVEFHCTSSDTNKILNTWNKIQSIYKGQLSICMNRTKLGDDEIINLLKTMVENTDNIIIQADGNPMSGGDNDYKSNLQTVAFAQVINNSSINAKLILSGGTNAKTTEFAKMCSIKIDGIAIGSYARKLVKEYINHPDFWDNKDIQNNAVKKAEELKNNLLLYL